MGVGLMPAPVVAAAARKVAGGAAAKGGGAARARAASQRGQAAAKVIGRATSRDRSELKRQARGGDDLLAEVYEQGRREGKSEAGTSSRKSHPAGKARGRRRPVGKSGVAARSTRRAAAQLRAPVERELTSGIRIAFLTLSLVALLLVLENARPFAGVIDAIGRGVEWLGSPDRSVPYAPGTAG